MKEFTNDEKAIARNIDQKYKWVARDRDGNLYVYEEKPKKEESSWYSDGCSLFFQFNHLFSAIKWKDEEPTRIRDIYNPQVLDDAEKRYLSAVIRPFKDKVLYIMKTAPCGSSKEHLYIGFTTFEETHLPCFNKGTMYKGMKTGHAYTLEELGL